jgi:hypothetical protein
MRRRFTGIKRAGNRFGGEALWHITAAAGGGVRRIQRNNSGCGNRKKKGEGLAAIPDRNEAIILARADPLPPIAPDRLAREKLIFRSYDSK